MRNHQYVAFDLETTGLNPSKDRIIEIGAVLVEKGDKKKNFSTLINIGKNIPSAATKINGIADKMLRQSPPPEKVLTEFKRFINNYTLIAHNAKFDAGFLRYEFARWGIDFPNQCRCTLAASRRRFPQLPNYRLATVYRHLFGGFPVNTTLHRALDDALLVAGIWERLLNLECRK